MRFSWALKHTSAMSATAEKPFAKTRPSLNSTSSGATSAPFLFESTSAATGTRRSRRVMQALRTAAPFRSAPEDAAVADVFGTLSVTVCIIRIRLRGKAELPHHDAENLGVQPLAHFRPPVAHLGRPVHVQENKGARLVVMGQREGDPEFYRSDGKAALHAGIVPVPRVDGPAPLGEIRLRHRLAPYLAKAVVSPISWKKWVELVSPLPR